MSYASINGAAMIQGQWIVPRMGVWRAIAELDTDTPPSGQVRLEWGGRAWVGTVRRSSVEDARCRVWVVGGVGDLGTVTAAQGFRDAKLSAVLDHILGAAGQSRSRRVSAALLNQKLAWFALLRQSAGRSLCDLCAALSLAWRMEQDGSLWIGAESWPAAEVDEDAVELLDCDGARATALVRMLDPVLMPGTRWRGARVSRLEHCVGAEKISTLIYFEQAVE